MGDNNNVKKDNRMSNDSNMAKSLKSIDSGWWIKIKSIFLETEIHHGLVKINKIIKILKFINIF